MAPTIKQKQYEFAVNLEEACRMLKTEGLVEAASLSDPPCRAPSGGSRR